MGAHVSNVVWIGCGIVLGVVGCGLVGCHLSLRVSSSLHHICVVPCGVFYWLRYCHLMVCAPHLSFIVVVLVLIMAWSFVPRVRRSGMLGVCMLFGGVWCGGCRWDSAGKGGWVGILNGFVEGHL